MSSPSSSSTLLSFFENSFLIASFSSPCRNLWLGPKFLPALSVSRPRSSSLVVQAKSGGTRREDRTARHTRIRQKVEGTPERPRLCVFRSNKHFYVQVIDDSNMHTLASASTMQNPISEDFDYSSGPTIEVAKKVGKVIARSCLEKGITKVAFDRGGYPYHAWACGSPC